LFELKSSETSLNAPLYRALERLRYWYKPSCVETKTDCFPWSNNNSADERRRSVRAGTKTKLSLICGEGVLEWHHMCVKGDQDQKELTKTLKAAFSETFSRVASVRRFKVRLTCEEPAK